MKSIMSRAETPERRLEVLRYPEIRISTASFARIRDERGRFALLVNKNRAKKGEVWLTPIGGAIETDAAGVEDLKSLLGIDEAAFKENEAVKEGKDLRFKMKGADVNVYREWFLERKHRESEPRRELREELVDETGLLEAADIDRLVAEAYALAGYAATVSETTRVGQEGGTTVRLLEIFDVRLPEESLNRLVKASEGGEGQIRFVTEEELALGRTEDGVLIGDVSRTLLDPRPTIEPFV